MNKNIFYIIMSLLIILLFSSLVKCNQQEGIADENLKALTDTVTYYKNTLGTQSASIRTLQVDKTQLQKNIIDKDNELKALTNEFATIRSVVKFQTITRFDTIKISYKDTVPTIFERKGLLSDKWYSFGYNSDQKGIKIDSFRSWTSASIITGTKRKWFLGEQTLKTEITFSNPYVTVTGVTAAEVVLPSPWYRKWYIWLALGAAGGFIMAK